MFISINWMVASSSHMDSRSDGLLGEIPLLPLAGREGAKDVGRKTATVFIGEKTGITEPFKIA